MKDSLKYGLLGVIALALVVNGYFLMKKSDTVSSTKNNIENVKNSVKKEAKNTLSANGAVTNNKTLDASKASNNKKAEPLIQSGPLTSMVFEEMAFDYGNIKQNTENTHVFKFTNTGSEPLIISKAKGSCGCTVPEYPNYPIAPGATDEIKVVYKPGKQKNKQSKTVTITANTEPSTTILRISAEVSPE